jgi:hypothetical protein
MRKQTQANRTIDWEPPKLLCRVSFRWKEIANQDAGDAGVKNEKQTTRHKRKKKLTLHRHQKRCPRRMHVMDAHGRTRTHDLYSFDMVTGQRREHHTNMPSIPPSPFQSGRFCLEYRLLTLSAPACTHMNMVSM